MLSTERLDLSECLLAVLKPRLHSYGCAQALFAVLLLMYISFANAQLVGACMNCAHIHMHVCACLICVCAYIHIYISSYVNMLMSEQQVCKYVCNVCVYTHTHMRRMCIRYTGIYIYTCLQV